MLREPYIIQFQANFRPKKMPQKSTEVFVIDAQLMKYLHYADDHFA